MHADGTGERPIVRVTTVESRQITNAELSPDGDTVAYTVGEETRIHLVDVDTGRERPVVVIDGADGSNANPARSPDGASLLFERVVGNEGHLAVASVVDGAIVQTGRAFEPESGLSAAFSPDGVQHRGVVRAGRLDLAPRPRRRSGEASPA